MLRSGDSLQRVLDLDPSLADDTPDAEYEDLFRNVIINMNVPEMSVLTMSPPANIYAVVHEHHYLEKDHETYILEHLQVTSISDEQIHTIELETRGQSTNNQWREKRTMRLHSNNLGLIYTVIQTTNFVKLAHSFTQYRHLNTEPIKHGETNEGTAFKEYIANRNVVVRSNGIVVCRNVVSCS